MVTFFILLLLHLPCFTFSSSRRRRTSAAVSPKTSFFSYFKRFFATSKLTPPLPLSHSSSKRNSYQLISPSPISAAADLHPCSVCGEILHSPSLLDHHLSLRHPISELADGENIVRIIFRTGWPDYAKPATIHKVLKIHNSSKIISRFEEYRERVKSRAAARPKPTSSSPSPPRDERCIADGNELLRFHCTTFACELDSGGGVCGRQFCSLCGIIRSGFSPKMDGISTLPTSHAAHASLPEGIEEEFAFMNVKRAVLVCRVIAGRVGCDPCDVDKEDPGFDSLAGRIDGGDDDDELLVFNPRAVLPCFVIVYTV